MPVARRSISLTLELDQALYVLSLRKRLPISKVIEILLREHPLVQREVETGRLEEGISVFAVSSRQRAPRAKNVKAGQRA